MAAELTEREDRMVGFTGEAKPLDEWTDGDFRHDIEAREIVADVMQCMSVPPPDNAWEWVAERVAAEAGASKDWVQGWMEANLEELTLHALRVSQPFDRWMALNR